MNFRHSMIYGAPLLALGLLVPIATKAQVKTTPSTKSAPGKPAPAVQPSLEPKAVEILKAMSSRLAAAHTLQFSSFETFESPSRQGHPLAYGLKSEVVMQRPDKLRVITSADGPPSEFYYDGKTMTAFAPAENLVAIADAPPTIDKALEAAYHSAGIYFPFTDLIVADPYGDAAPGMKLAYYVGQSRTVGDTTTDVVAFVGDGVFAQVWIGAEDKLPRLIHALYLDDPLQLRHNLFLSNWQLDGDVPADTFGSERAQGAKRIPFAHPHPDQPAGAHPPKRSTDTKKGG